MANFIMGIISLTISAVVLANVFLTTVMGTNFNGTPLYTYTIDPGYTAENSTCVFGSLSNCTAVTSYPQAWTTAEVALWGLLSIAAIAGLVYGVLNVFGLA